MFYKIYLEKDLKKGQSIDEMIDIFENMCKHRTSVVDDFLRCLQNISRRAVVLFEFDDGCARKITFEIKDVCKICATPRVDGLSVITDYADIP